MFLEFSWLFFLLSQYFILLNKLKKWLIVLLIACLVSYALIVSKRIFIKNLVIFSVFIIFLQIIYLLKGTLIMYLNL